MSQERKMLLKKEHTCLNQDDFVFLASLTEKGQNEVYPNEFACT